MTMRSETVMRHGAEGFASMQKAGRLAAKVLDMITPHVITGASTEHLDRLCHDYILAHGATPAPLNYKGFPKSTCISRNTGRFWKAFIVQWCGGGTMRQNIVMT